ncbi:MAG: hypothetical protein HYV07_15430 [Deltaproteobacteria bacterium]|nr:hypothetical protein [Deltaproteobacteria bacterium]
MVIAVPRTMHLLELCVRALPSRRSVLIVENGPTLAERSFLDSALPDLPRLRLRGIPGVPAPHGVVLTLLVRAIDTPFFIIDHDCYVLDDSVFDTIRLAGSDVVAGIDSDGFMSRNEAAGLSFPRTHFLLLHPERLRALTGRASIDLNKRAKTPRHLAARLRTIGIGDHNFPRTYQRSYDTMTLACAVALAEGWTLGAHRLADGMVRHIGGTSWAFHGFMKFVHARMLELTRDPRVHRKLLKLEASSERLRAELDPELRSSRLVAEVDAIAAAVAKKLSGR